MAAVAQRQARAEWQREQRQLDEQVQAKAEKDAQWRAEVRVAAARRLTEEVSQEETAAREVVAEIELQQVEHERLALCLAQRESEERSVHEAQIREEEERVAV